MQRLKKTVDMTEGPFLKKMILFAIPIIITGLFQCFYGAADTIVVGYFRGDLAVAAVGSTNSLTNLIVGLFMGLSVGAGVCVAQHTGAKEDDEVKKTAYTAVILSVVCGAIIAVIGFLFAEEFLNLMETPAEVLPLATLYLKIIFLGIPASMLFNYIAAMLRSVGDSKRPLIFLSISGVVNIELNIILIAVFDMGVEGVAIATIFSQYLMATMALVYLFRTSGVLRVSLKGMRIYWDKAKRMLYIGIPSGIQSTLFSLSNVIIQSSLNSFGDVVVAGAAAASSIESFIYSAINSMYHTSLTFVGQNVGARKLDNVKRIVVRCIILAVVMGIILNVLLLVFGNSLVKLYVKSDTAIEVAIQKLWIIGTTYFLCGIMEVFSGMLRALGRSFTSMIISLIGACGLRIVWIMTVFKWFPYPETVYFSYPVTWTATVLIQLVVSCVVLRKVIKRAKEENLSEI